MRLTNTIKEAIQDIAVHKAGITDANNALKLKRADWAERARVMSLGMPEEKVTELLDGIQDLYAQLPSGIVHGWHLVGCKNTSIYVNVAGQGYNAYYSGNFKANSEEDKRKLTNTNGVVFVATHPMAIEWTALLQEGRDLHKQENDLRAEVRAAMVGINTAKQLLAVWPEAIELLPPEKKKATNTLPMVQTMSLNKAIGLPSKDQGYVSESGDQ